MNELDDFLCERQCEEEYPDEFWEYLFTEHIEEEWQKEGIEN